ncbi:N-acetylglucosaminidase [Nosocomiicoccus ampullae]|uniref:N-acetylglucosaminidase n=1 Tax=Nosocomiicoccus ampullae TaxID=489910 RepID=UPI00254EC7E2|nr:N-acetylglucosaminidase [Nosocomiicoccus ampullae]MDK6862909.1 N-acetylglucosaminidase [Nosocomiicoccus ampullae]
MNKSIQSHAMVIMMLIVIVTFIIAFIVSMSYLVEPEDEPLYTFEEALQLQLNNGTEDLKFDSGYLVPATEDDIKNAMDPKNQGVFQFVQLDNKSKISVEDANELLKDSGVLKDTGEFFVQAEKEYNVNALYLIAHAKIETGNGKSELAKGIKVDGTTYYNYFGIGAFDIGAIKTGSSYAKKANWNSKENAILGGAKFIKEHYFDNNQVTLYDMRWNPNSPGTHLYATDIRWSDSIARVLESHYEAVQLKPDFIEKDIYKEE